MSKHCAEIILRLYIRLPFYSSYYSTIVIFRLRRNLCKRDPIEATYPNLRESLGVSIQMKSGEKVGMYLQ